MIFDFFNHSHRTTLRATRCNGVAKVSSPRSMGHLRPSVYDVYDTDRGSDSDTDPEDERKREAFCARGAPLALPPKAALGAGTNSPTRVVDLLKSISEQRRRLPDQKPVMRTPTNVKDDSFERAVRARANEKMREATKVRPVSKEDERKRKRNLVKAPHVQRFSKVLLKAGLPKVKVQSLNSVTTKPLGLVHQRDGPASTSTQRTQKPPLDNSTFCIHEDSVGGKDNTEEGSDAHRFKYVMICRDQAYRQKHGVPVWCSGDSKDEGLFFVKAGSTFYHDSLTGKNTYLQWTDGSNTMYTSSTEKERRDARIKISRMPTDQQMSYTIPNIKTGLLRAGDLKSLLNGELTGGIMNAVRDMLLSDHIKECRQDVYIFDTAFTWKLRQGGGKGDMLERNIESTRSWNWGVPYDILKCVTMLVPVHISDCHWALCVVDIRFKSLRYFDPLGGKSSDGGTLDRILEWVKRMFCLQSTTGWQKIYVTRDRRFKIPLQENGYDCGVYVLKYMECIMDKDVCDFCARDITRFRGDFLYRLLRTSSLCVA